MPFLEWSRIKLRHVEEKRPSHASRAELNAKGFVDTCEEEGRYVHIFTGDNFGFGSAKSIGRFPRQDSHSALASLARPFQLSETVTQTPSLN